MLTGLYAAHQKRFNLLVSKLYELKDKPVFSPDAPVSMKDYEGKVLLVYNAAAL